MNVFITGGAGFVGSHLVDRLIADHCVVVFDNMSSGRREFIEKHFSNKRFAFIKGDLLDLSLLKRSMKGADVVFHMAANPDIRYGIAHTDIDLKQGAIVTYNVLEAMRVNDVRKIVFSSSSVVYGEPTVFPTPEEYGPLLPISLYGASKLASEGLISSFCHTFEMQSWIFRFANIIGKRQTHGALVDFIHKLNTNNNVLHVLGDGTQKKSYLHIDDCVDGILFGFKHARQEINVFNLSARDQITVKRIVEIFSQECLSLKDMRFKIEFEKKRRGWQGDVMEMMLDPQRINRLGWRASCTSAEAVLKAIHDLLGGLRCR